MKVVIIKYNAGNVRSVDIALQRLGITVTLSDSAEEIKAADKVIFPGVGAAGNAIQYLKKNRLDTVIRELTQPVLGICLGMQLLCSYSEEGNTDCLGIFPQRVKRFTDVVKTPQVGWNNISELRSTLFNGIKEFEYMYFVHSYYADVSEYTIASTNCNYAYSAALQKDNFYAVQFHPEKSGTVGAQLLKNFIEL